MFLSLAQVLHCPALSYTNVHKSLTTISATARRSANYKPNVWNHEYLQSLNSVYGEKRFLERAEKLKDETKLLLENTNDPYDQIELVDVLQRLGIFYHFTHYVDRILESMYNIVVVDGHQWNIIDNLHATALSFRLLRQHGYRISPEVFRNFMNERGNFEITLCNDIKGLLSLYEASYLSMEGESILDAAQVFATRHLKQKLNQNINKTAAEEISHALELPLHWRIERLESRWFIDAYQRKHDLNPLLLELAILDFNIVQSMYQDELKELSRWHTETRLAAKIPFARDRIVQCFLWAVGIIFEPCSTYYRMLLAKFVDLATFIDDMYDVYGTLEELQLFTDVVDRWDINALEQLPEYMRICFFALFNTVNETAYDFLKDQGFNILPYSKKRWADLCKKYLKEAEWYYSEHKPSLNEYLSIAWVSIGGPVSSVHAYFFVTPLDQVNEKSIQDLQTHPQIIKWTSLVCRLADDLGTATDELKRGDNPKSIQCYMHDTGCSEEESRAYIKNLISSTWKKINEDVVMNCDYSREFKKASMNFARLGQCMYQNDMDGYGALDDQFNARILSLFLEPISLP